MFVKKITDMVIDISKLPPGFKLELTKEHLVAFAEVLLQNRIKVNPSSLDFEESPMNVKEVAKLLDVSVQHIYFLTSNKKIPHHKMSGKKLHFFKSEVIAYIKENRQSTQKDIDVLANEYLNKKKG